MMKKLLFVFLALLTVNVVIAQEQRVKSLLDEVSNKYDSYKTIESKFTFKADQVSGESYTDHGEMFLNKRGNQYRIVLPAQELISDGESVWSILKEDKEVQISQADNSNESIGPNNIFTFYRKGFKYVGKADESIAGVGKLNVIELTPENTKGNYSKIRIRINKNKHIHDVLIFDKSGAKYTYTINNLYVNYQLAPSNFKFEKGNYSGFEIVDLR